MITGACPRCGKERPLSGRVGGDRACRSCYEVAHAKVCAGCARLRPVNNRDADGRGWCSGCRNKAERARRESTWRADIVAAVVSAFPKAEASVVEAALAEAVTSRVSLRRLAGHLAAHPDAFQGGPTSILPVLDRLVVALQQGGLPVVQIHPVCDGCGRQKRWHARTATGGECTNCRAKSQRTRCSSCGRTRRVDHRDPVGQPVCASCTEAARRDATLAGLAAEIIATVREADPGLDEGAVEQAIAATARKVPGRARLVHLLAEAPNLAGARHRPVPVARFLSAARQRGIALAAARCEECGGPAEPLVTHRGVVRCLACARHCPGCGRSTKEVTKALCAACEASPRRGQCAGCGAVALRDETGRCYRCRAREERRCARCDAIGPRTRMFEVWLCSRCALVAVFDTKIAPPEHLPAPLVPLRDALLGSANWRIASAWLTRSVGGQVLGRLARGELPITHEALDRAAAGGKGANSVGHLRALLVATGALPDAADRPLDAFEGFVAHRLATASIGPADAKVARAFIRWEVMPALRSRAGTTASTTQPLLRARADLAATIGLLEWLAGRDRELRSLTQSDVDEWFSQPGHRAWRMRPFLVWAASRRHLPAGIALPRPPSREMLSPIDHEARWQIARRLVADDTIPTDHRVAASLLVLYGQTLVRIARLSTADVHRGADGAVVVVLGGTPLPIHEPFASLIGELPLPRTNGVSDRARSGHWLFPGRRAGHPVGAVIMGNWMRGLGIEPRQVRNTARAQLAGEIPAAMLAEILGINATTATRWTAIANGNWAAYVGGRAGAR